MIRRKLSPSEIVDRLQVIEALTEDGQPLDDAIRLVGLLPSDYLRWRLEYAGLSAPSDPRRTRRGACPGDLAARAGRRGSCTEGGWGRG